MTGLASFIAALFAGLSGMLTGFMVAFFLRHFGAPGVFLFVAASMAVVIVSVAGLGPRTNNLELEAIAH